MFQKQRKNQPDFKVFFLYEITCINKKKIKIKKRFDYNYFYDRMPILEEK